MRQAPEVFGSVFASPADTADPTGWDALAGDKLYSTAAWLAYCAREEGGATAGLRVPVTGGGSAGTVLTAVTRQADLSGPYRWTDILRRFGLATLPDTGLMVGSRRGYQASLLRACGPNVSQAASALLPAIRTAAAQLPAQAAVVGMFLNTADVRALRAAGVRSLPVILRVDAWIGVPEGGFPAWLATLPGGRRQNVRREIRLFEQAGYDVVHGTLGQYVDTAAVLIANTEARHGTPLDPAELARSLRDQADALQESARVIVAMADGVPVGFLLYFVRGSVLYARSAGFDYDRLKGAAEYFNLVYYIPLKLAGPAGVRQIHLGIEAAEAKALRGASLGPLWLLDLSAEGDSDDNEVRLRNRGRLDELERSSPAVAAALDRDEWLEFC